MNTEHPAAAAAREAANAKRTARKLEQDIILRAKREHDVRFVTIGDYSICYRIDRRNVIEISTAIKHPNDRFDKHMGQWVALQRFTNNNRSHMKVPSGLSPKQFLSVVFSLFN